MWEIVTRSPLFPQFKDGDGQQLKDHILSGGRPVIPDSVPDSVSSLMTRCWAEKPSARPSFDQVTIKTKIEE